MMNKNVDFLILGMDIEIFGEKFSILPHWKSVSSDSFISV